MSQHPIISLRDVGVSYKRSGSLFRKTQYFEALRSINMDIYSGETLGILGRNGAGKSTLLKVISGIIRPDTGEVINYGVSVSLLALQAGFDPKLSGKDNAILSGMLQGYRHKDIQSKLDEIKSFSELDDFFYEPVRTYSNGMRARLGFSISMLTSPDVLLIDEALSVGDKEFKKKAEKVITEKVKSDQTVVIVSHIEQQISRLCSRVIRIENKVAV